MLRINQSVVEHIIAPTLVTFFFIGGVVAVAVSVGLIMRSPQLFRLFERMNRFVTLRQATRAIEIPRDSSPLVWKYRQFLGIVFILGAIYSVWGLFDTAGSSAIVLMLTKKQPGPFLFWIAESLRYFLIVGGVVSIIVGILLIVSPDTVKSLEKIGARWYSTRQLTRDVDKMNLSFDRWVTTYPRTAGLILILPALGVMVHFGELLLKRL
ncbi:MAG: hypothetical protein HY847_12555 [Betaproteobacteria bacterium]|nr:hypothetical protein [Betaproteobacteria bacterium]